MSLGVFGNVVENSSDNFIMLHSRELVKLNSKTGPYLSVISSNPQTVKLKKSFTYFLLRLNSIIKSVSIMIAFENRVTSRVVCLFLSGGANEFPIFIDQSDFSIYTLFISS